MKTAQKLPRFFDAVKRHAPLIIPRLTLRRMANLALLWLEMKTKACRLRSKPVMLKIEASNRCNLRCIGCRSGEMTVTYPAGDMAPGLFEKILDDIGSCLLGVVFYIWGEPTMNRDLPAMIAMAHKRNISVAISTNLHFLDERYSRALLESKIDKMVVALDGFSQGTYGTIRIGGDFRRALDNLERFARMKKERRAGRPVLEWQFVVTDDTIDEIEKARSFASEIGIDRFVILQDWAGRLTDWRYFKKLPAFRKSLSKKQKSCYWLYTTASIQWDGTVFPCCYVANRQDSNRIFGSLAFDRFGNIWNNDFYRSARRHIKSSEFPTNSVCAECLTPPVFSSPATDFDHRVYDDP